MDSTPTWELAPTSSQRKLISEKTYCVGIPRHFCQNERKLPTYPLHPIKTNNARALRIPAAAGTELAGASFYGYS